LLFRSNRGPAKDEKDRIPKLLCQTRGGNAICTDDTLPQKSKEDPGAEVLGQKAKK
jgi:hypothetical protein